MYQFVFNLRKYTSGQSQGTDMCNVFVLLFIGFWWWFNFMFIPSNMLIHRKVHFQKYFYILKSDNKLKRIQIV